MRWQRFLYKGRLNRLHIKKWKNKRGDLKKSQYYKKLFDNYASLNEFPIINKKVFMDNFDSINTVGIHLNEAFKVAEQAEKSRDFSPTIDKITIGLSSGTSGNRGVFLASEDERAQWVAAVLDRVIGISFRKRKVAFFLRANSNLYDSVKSKLLQFEFFDLLEDHQKHIFRLNNLQPTFLVAQPSMLLVLARSVESKKLMIKPEKIISVAEVLYPEDKTYLESIFEKKIHQVYQCTEGFLASTCSNGVLHFHEDFFIIEKKYIDDSKERFHPIITDLERSSQPVIRYELNDVIKEKKECSCGSDWLAISSIEGRSDDVLNFVNIDGKSHSIFPDFFRRAIIMASEEIREYALIQNNITQLQLYVEGTDEQYQKASSAIQELLTNHQILDVVIERIESTKTEKGNKLRRIRNEQGITN